MAVTTRTVTMRQAINEALSEEMERDDTVILLGEDVAGGGGVPALEGDEAAGGVMGVTAGLVGKFGRGRVLDTPISEAGFIGAAGGAAATGLRPVADLMFVEFAGVCLDQLFNQAAKMRYMFGGNSRVPLVVRAMIGAGLGAAGQHSGCHYSILAHFPGLKTVAPSTPADAKGLLKAAIRDDDPVIFLEHKMMYDVDGELPEGEHVVPLGSADIKREGDDVTIVSVSRMVQLALEAAGELAEAGIEAEVVDLRSLSPLDTETVLNSVSSTGRLLVVDEDNPRCSIASDIIALVAMNVMGNLKTPPRMLTAPHTPVPFSPVLEQFYLPSTERIVAAVKALT